MSKLATRLAKLALRTLPAYPGPDYRPPDQITAEAGIRLARLAYEDESESGCGFLKYFEGKVKLSEGVILDLGCGFGGRLLAFQRTTGAYCVGVDIDSRASIAGLQLARSMGSINASFAAAVGESLPFVNDSFDAVLCYDVMLARSNFEVLRLDFLPLLNKMIRQFHRWKMRYYAWLFYPLSGIPVLQELFTHRIVAILRKP